MKNKSRNMRSIKPPTGRMAFLIIVLIAACMIFIGRLLHLQFASDPMYDTGISSVSKTYVEIPTVRGEITDVNGVVLASNITSDNITMDKNRIPAGTENEVIFELSEFFARNNVQYRDILPVSARAPFLLDADFGTSSEKQKYVRNYAKYMGLDENRLTENNTILYEVLLSRYNIPESYTEEQVRRIAGIRFTLDVNAYSTTSPCVLVENAGAELVGKISDSFHLFPGLSVSASPRRIYNIDRLASHILGHTGSIFAEDAEYYRERGYSLNETVGKDGTEYAFEEYLCGINGVKEITTSPDGKEILDEKVIKQPKPGYTVSLTIDAEMQAAAEAALERVIKEQARTGARSGKKNVGEDANAGAVVVMDPRDASIRVSASYPTYSLNTFAQDIEVLGKDEENRPLVNRATNGIYEPGSTFKIATAAAALYHGVTDLEEIIYDKGEYDFHATYKPHCWIYDAEGRTHGYQNIVQAIQNSCNYYFFEMGKRLGIEKINSYAQSLGLGVKTGIETGEVTGVLVSPQYMDANGQVWNPGYVLQAAIGQQHLFTPLQIASYISTFLNGGKRYEAHLFSKATDYVTGEVIAEYQPRVLSDAQIPQETVDALKTAMRRVVDDGTASSTFIGYKYPVGGKTGTAQVSGGSENVIFVGFAPYEDPEIVVTVVLEHGYQSRNAAMVAKEVFDSYFKQKYPLDFGIAVVNPDGSVTNPDGTVKYPDGSVLNTDGSTVYPDGSKKRADGSIVYADGSIKATDGSIAYPDGSTLRPDGSVLYPDGAIKSADGTLTAANGEVTKPDGTVIKPDGTVIPPKEQGKPPKSADDSFFETTTPNTGITVSGDKIRGDLEQ